MHDYNDAAGIFRSLKNPLRKRCMYPRKSYYLAALWNLFGRGAWILSISVGFFSDFEYDYIRTSVAVVEICRRFVWNFFRIENEHLNNCGAFRATKDIELPFTFIRSDEVDFLVQSDIRSDSGQSDQESGNDESEGGDNTNLVTTI